MTALAAASASTLAHCVHYGLVLGGLTGLVLLLAPPLLARAGLTAAAPPDRHQARVAALRRQLAAGAPGAPAVEVPDVPVAVVTGSRTALPLAVVASAAAAGAHAAVTVAHLDPAPGAAAFLAACALAQLTWAALLLRRPTRGLMLLGLLGNLGVLAVWLLSRTTGLPGLPVEPFGAWDLACAGWELVVVAVCATRLRAPAPDIAPGWAWTPSPRGLLAGSVLALGLLSLGGAAS